MHPVSEVYQRTGLVHQSDGNQAVLALAQQAWEQMFKVGNQRYRRSLQLDVVIVTGTHVTCLDSAQVWWLYVWSGSCMVLRLWQVVGGVWPKRVIWTNKTRAHDCALHFPTAVASSS
jgi:hypothetical protein